MHQLMWTTKDRERTRKKRNKFWQWFYIFLILWHYLLWCDNWNRSHGPFEWSEPSRASCESHVESSRVKLICVYLRKFLYLMTAHCIALRRFLICMSRKTLIYNHNWWVAFSLPASQAATTLFFSDCIFIIIIHCFVQLTCLWM